METTEAFPIKKSPVVLTIIFNVLTLGIYSCCWFLIRRKGFNKVSKSEKLGINIFIIGLILRIVIIMLYTASGVFETEGTQDALATEENIKLVAALLRLVFVVILIVQSFKAKAMLEEYRQNKDQFSTPLSGTATFFFRIYYLQYRVNQMHKNKSNQGMDPTSANAQSVVPEG